MAFRGQMHCNLEKKETKSCKNMQNTMEVLLGRQQYDFLHVFVSHNINEYSSSYEHVSVQSFVSAAVLSHFIFIILYYLFFITQEDVIKKIAYK